MQTKDIKSQFPIFSEYPDLVYLDNAATTQKPQMMIDAVVDFYTKYNANVHRGIYPLSEVATDMYEEARRKVADFIGAEPEEIVFTGGTTEGINMIASMLYAGGLITDEATVLTTDSEHHANILPWQQLGTNLQYMAIDENYQYVIDPTVSADLIAISLVSNVTGAIADVAKIRSLYPDCYLVVDAAQAIAHMPIDVKKLDIDFMVFSGHKMYGPTGIGVLYAKKGLLEKLPPVKVGGGMINKVDRDSATWADLPEKFEAGTPPIAQAIGLGAAVDFINSIGWETIENHEQDLHSYIQQKLSEISDLTLYHPTYSGVGVFSFSIAGIHPHDLAQVLGQNNVAVRAGHHCTQILHREVFEIPATTRASIAIYNSQTDIDKLISEIYSAQRLFN